MPVAKILTLQNTCEHN